MRRKYDIIKLMAFFRKNKESKKTIGIIDVGSASIGGLILEIDAERKIKPKIISSCRLPINFLLELNFDAYWQYTSNTLKKVFKFLFDSSRSSHSKPEEFFCFFSSPWFVSQTRIVRVRRKSPFKITEDFIDKLIDNEKEILKSQWQVSVYPSVNKEKEVYPEVIECDTMKFKVNGYTVKNPIDKEGKSLEIYIYMSMGIKKVMDKIKDICFENFGDISLQFKTLPITVFNVLENFIKPEGGYIFADIGGEISDMSLVRNDILEETVSFSEGRNSLVKRIAKKFKTSFAEAESVLERYNKNHLNKSDSKKLSLIIDKTQERWSKLIGDALKEIFENGPLPQEFFLLGARSAGPEFVKVIKDPSFSQYTILGKPFNVQTVLPSAFSSYFHPESKKIEDIFLIIESLYI